jgi:hypothetical protein
MLQEVLRLFSLVLLKTPSHFLLLDTVTAGKTLFFVLMPKGGSTTARKPHIMKYTDGFGNLCQREVERPEVISTFS